MRTEMIQFSKIFGAFKIILMFLNNKNKVTISKKIYQKNLLPTKILKESKSKIKRVYSSRDVKPIALFIRKTKLTEIQSLKNQNQYKIVGN